MGGSSHLFLGVFPLSLGVNMLALMNILVSFVIICVCSSTESLNVVDVEITPFWQLALATWASFGVIAAIFGGVGAVYRISRHLHFYLIYLIACTIIEVIMVVYFAVHTSICPRARVASISASESFGNSFVCGVSQSFSLIIVLACVGITAYGCFVVNAARVEARNRQNTELLRYEEPFKQAAAFGSAYMAEQEANAPMAPNLILAARPMGVSYAAAAPAAQRSQMLAYPGA